MNRFARPFIALVALTALAACGDDTTPDASPDTTLAISAPDTTQVTTADTTTDTTADTTTDTTPETTAATASDISTFCDAKVAFDGVSSDTPDEEAFAAYVAEASARASDIAAAAPPELQAAAITVANTLAGLNSLDEGTAAHVDQAYASAREELAVAVHERCDFGRLTLDIADNAYSSATVEVANGVNSVLVNNADATVHVTIIAKLAEGTTADQLLADPDLFEANATIVAVVVGGPNVADGAALQLDAGGYIYFNPEHVVTGMAGAFSVPG